MARMTGSTANSQALKYYLAVDEETCAKIYPSLAWAGALPDWDGPEEGERPSAYIVIVCDGSIAKNKMWDEGIAAQTIMLGAAEKGLGGCMIGSINRSQLAEDSGTGFRTLPHQSGASLGKTEGNRSNRSCGRRWQHYLLPR